MKYMMIHENAVRNHLGQNKSNVTYKSTILWAVFILHNHLKNAYQEMQLDITPC